MKTYYIALGKYEEDEFCYGMSRYIVSVNDRELALDLEEYLIWNLLSKQVMNFSELQANVIYTTHELHINTDFDTTQKLGRLISRGLVACGDGETDVDALLSLFQSLYVIPLRETLPYRIVSGFYLLSKFKVPLRQLLSLVFVCLTPAQKKIYRLSTTRKMRVLEIVDALHQEATEFKKLSVLNDLQNLFTKNRVIFEGDRKE